VAAKELRGRVYEIPRLLSRLLLFCLLLKFLVVRLQYFYAMSVIETKGSGNGKGVEVLSTSPNVDTSDVVENFEPNLSTWQIVSLSIR
jgi:hypothetical protein